MEKLPLALFYRLGMQLGRVAATPLDAANVNLADHTNLWSTAFIAVEQIKQLIVPPYNMRVAKETFEEFSREVNRYGEFVYPPPPPESGQPPRPAPSDWARNSARRQVILRAIELQAIIQAEWGTWAAYIVPQQGIYETEGLIERAEFTLPEEARSKMHPLVLSEVREAGRCLAFGLPTASGFHMMRAIEIVVWMYCQTVDVPGKDKPRRSQNWGQYTAYLHTSNQPDVKEVLALLQQLKNNQRNLIMHPEKVLSPDDAFRLFEEGQSAIIAMADRLLAGPVHDGGLGGAFLRQNGEPSGGPHAGQPQRNGEEAYEDMSMEEASAGGSQPAPSL